MEKTDERNFDTLIYQIYGMTQLLYSLNENNFLDSDYFQKCKNHKFIKYCLSESGIGNPATLQMLLYGLLVIPYEQIKVSSANDTINNYINEQKINNYIKDNYYSLESSYKDEMTNNTVDPLKVKYINHIRNSISHNSCSFPDDKTGYMTFTDVNPKNENQIFKLEISTSNVEIILMNLLNSIHSYLRDKYPD